MKKRASIFVILFAIAFAQVRAQQISETDAKLLYQKAEDAYNNTDYYGASKILYDLYNKQGKWTSRVLYLYLKSSYENMTASSQRSSSSYKESFDNYVLFGENCDKFFQIIDKATYPQEKYNDIVAIHQYFKQKAQEHANEKDRTPQDAINFLNECAKKFFHIDNISPYYPYYVESQYWLEDSILIISFVSRVPARPGSPAKDNHVTRAEIRIDLSKTWLEDIYTRVCYPNRFDREDFSSLPYCIIDQKGSSLTEEGKSVPHIISKIIYINNEPFCQDIKGKVLTNYNKNYDFDNRLYEGRSFNNINKGFYIYSFFITSREFVANNYKDRIKEAFEFLIKYYGGGDKDRIEKEAQKANTGNSKF